MYFTLSARTLFVLMDLSKIHPYERKKKTRKSLIKLYFLKISNQMSNNINHLK